MLEILPGYPDDVVAVAARGRVSAEDYRTVLAPEVARRIAAHGSVRLLYQLGPDCEGLTAAAGWQDLKLGIAHWSQFHRLAVVTDIGWIRDAVLLFAPIFHHPVRVFANDEMAEARAWILAREPP